MMKLRTTLYAMLSLMTVAGGLSGCIEEYEADIATEDSGLLVVEGTICSSQVNTFVLSRTQPLGDEDGQAAESYETGWYRSTPLLIDGATVSVRGSDGSEYMAEGTHGSYSCQMGTLNPDVEYYLHIETDGDVYESEPQKPLRTEGIADVHCVQDTPESSIDVLITPDAPVDPDKANYYAWTYDETWEVRPEYTTVVYYDLDSLGPVKKANLFPKCGWIDARGATTTIGTSTSYDGQHIRSLKIYDIGRGAERLYYRYSGLVHQRAISKGEYEYELARRQASSEMGGLFTPQPSALPTNIRCLTSKKRALGFVGCSLNTSDYRFFLNASDFSIFHPQLEDRRIWLDEPSEADCVLMVYKGMHLCEWESPLMSPDGLLHTAWAYLSQLDVRYKYSGAYIEEPDFWASGAAVGGN